MSLPSVSSTRLYKRPTFHLNPLSRELWFWHNWLPRKCFKPLHVYPSGLRNTCFKFVCLPLPRFSSFPSISSAWSLGMFTMKLVFQDSSTFSQATLSSPFCLKACSVICILCLHLRFLFSPKKGRGTPDGEALGALAHASPVAELFCQPFHTDLTRSFCTDQAPGFVLFHYPGSKWKRPDFQVAI